MENQNPSQTNPGPSFPATDEDAKAFKERPGEAPAKNQSGQLGQGSQVAGYLSDTDPAFYNVMPRVASENQIIEPTLKVQTAPALTPLINREGSDKNMSGLWSKYKLYIIMALLLILGGSLAYFGVRYASRNAYQPENLLLTSPNATTTGQTTNDSQEYSLWLSKYFGNATCNDEKLCGQKADPDRDGLINIGEFKLGTDPNNADSDGDGLADGDEVNVFSTNPLDSNTAKDPKYSDADYMVGGYSVKTGNLLTDQEKKDLGDKMNSNDLHLPTVKTLLSVLNSLYGFSKNMNDFASSTPKSLATTSPLSGIDLSPVAKQDRDAQRSNTIKNLEIALIKYFEDNRTFPKASNVQDVYQAIRPYLKVASNPVDPINKDIYVYGYLVTDQGDDFTLSFYSESAGQVIKKHAAEGRKDRAAEEAGIYDDQRKNDLESLRSALLVYSSKNVAGNQVYVFPTVQKYKTDLVPNYLSSIPKDPKTQTDYQYQVSDTFDSFTLKAIFDNPSLGTTGYLCNQEECRNY